MSYPLTLINGFPPGEFGKRYCSRCDAHCCRRGVYVPLRKGELKTMVKLAHKLQRNVRLSLDRILKDPIKIPLKELETHGDMLWIMSFHMSEPCGFLDLDTNRCLIYDERPKFCRGFYCPGGPGGPLKEAIKKPIFLQQQ